MRREAVTYPKWWGKLDYEEQKEYIHDHPGTQLRTTAVRPESSKVKVVLILLLLKDMC